MEPINSSYGVFTAGVAPVRAIAPAGGKQHGDDKIELGHNQVKNAQVSFSPISQLNSGNLGTTVNAEQSEAIKALAGA